MPRLPDDGAAAAPPRRRDGRSDPATQWLVEGLIPRGAIVAIADLDDGSPEHILADGCFDVVLYLHDRGAMDTRTVLFSAHWRDGLVPGWEPPAPFWIRQGPCGWG